MKPFTRSDRISGKIQKALSDLLQKKINDPRLEMVVITSVKVSQDLKVARVYFTTPSDKKSIDEAIEGFASALGYTKRALAHQLGLRYMPDLKFFYDESFDYGLHIDSVIESTKKENGSDNTSFEK